ncbi:MAG: NACHT domain-containing NTPase, partial [Gammaproteobacteria bacterium]
MGKRKKGAFHNPTSANLSPTRERLRKTAEERKNAGEQSEAQASLQACADMFDPSGLDQYDYSSTLEQTPQQISSVLINYYRSLQIKLLLYPDCKLPLCDHFIELSIQSGNVYQKTIDSYLAPQALNGEDSYEASTNLYGLKSGIIQPNNILTKEGDNKALILGTAGIGKSTLSDYLCSLYAERKLGYKWVFKLPLRSLTKDRYRNSQEKIKLIDVLERECLSVACSSDPDNFKLSKKSKHLLADALKECTKKNEVLIIADGIDELIDHLTESTRVLLKKLLTFKQLIVTTRPYNLHQLRRDLEFEHTSLYEITGFPEKTIAKYSEDFFLATSVKEESNIDGFKSFLLQNPHINGACRIPIYLELLCSAWKHQPISIEIYNITSIYSLVVTFIGRRYLSKAGIATNDLLNSVIQDKCKNPLGTLEHLGFHSITHGKVYFKLDASLDYLQSLKPAVDISDVIVKDQKEFGFIRPNNPSGEYDGSGVFYFNHLTFRDFFAARFMVSCLQQESQPSANASFVTSFVHLWPKPNEHTLQDFILQKRHDEKYEFIWWFMVGLLNDARDIKSIEYFFKILFGFEDLIEISNFLLLIRCLDEAGSYQEQIANSIFNYIKRWLELTFKPQLNIVLGTYIHSQLLNRLKISPTIFTASLIQDPLIELIEECDTEELLRILYFLERLNHKFPKTLEKAIIQNAFVEWPDNNFRAKLTT